MSVKSLAPIALGIGALYLFSTKGSPFAQQPRKPGAKPGGEHVGPPKPETETPNSKAKTPKPFVELHRVFNRRNKADTFQKRVVVELDEPGRIREISDEALPMSHVLAAAKALVANDGVACTLWYNAALAEAEKVPRAKTNNQHRQLKRAHRHSMLLDRTNTVLNSTGAVSLSQAVMTQQTIRARYEHVD